MGFKRKYIVPLMIAVLVIFGCSPSAEKPSRVKYRETKLLMGTIVQVDVCHQPGEEPRRDKAYQEIWQRLENIHWRMSVFNGKSDVARINRSYQNPQTIGADTYQLIKDAVYYSELTRGAFDITVWPLIKLWQKGEEDNLIPPDDKIKETRQVVGVNHIRLMPENRVAILNPLTRVDLGGIAKGYAVDETVRIFRKNGFTQFFIDAGGDIYVGGKSCKNQPWRIGIRDPRNTSEIMEVVELEDAAVTTSGDYEQYYEIRGQRWSHIMNPVTGYPQKGVVSATVIAPTATAADALSTALCVLDPRQGAALIDSQGKNHAVLIITLQDENKIRKYKSRMWGSP